MSCFHWRKKVLNIVVKKHKFLRQSFGPCVRIWRVQAEVHVPKQLGRAATPMGQGAQGRSSRDPSPTPSPGPAELIWAPHMDPSLASWGSPSPAAPRRHIAHLPTVTAVECKNYLHLLALQKAKLCQSTIWQQFMFFYRINLTFKHQDTIFIYMEVNSSYNGPQLL